MTFFLVIDHKFLIPPYFRCFSSFPPCFAKIILSPYFYKFSPCFRQIHLLFNTLRVFPPPYFDHDAFMHHPMHVLDTPVYIYAKLESPCALYRPNHVLRPLFPPVILRPAGYSVPVHMILTFILYSMNLLPEPTTLVCHHSHFLIPLFNVLYSLNAL